jgi:alkanesulfonate monooxygenase SsuD/methylene tetrahydromethanopterin reductase-like flavin-dependent oxidoreductase (luciferase family)
MRPLKVGAFIPHLEGMYENGGTPGWAEMKAIAQAAEGAGFDSIWVADHLLYRIPGMESFGTWECWTMVSALAAVTNRVEIGTMVSVTLWRNPGLFAKILDTAEEVSGGRIIAGLGAGSHDAEFPAFGFEGWNNRVTRFEEDIAILAKLLRTGRITHNGRFRTLEDCELRPRGPRPEGPPIMIGAVGPRMLKTAVEHADQWNIPWRHDLADVVSEIERGDKACVDFGRDPATLSKSVCLQVDMPRGPDNPRTDLMEQSRAQALKADAIADHLRSYAEAGVSHVQLWLDPSTPEAVASFGEVLADLDRS